MKNTQQYFIEPMHEFCMPKAYEYDAYVQVLDSTLTLGYNALGTILLNEFIKCANSKAHKLNDILGKIMSVKYRRQYTLAVKAFLATIDGKLHHTEKENIEFYKISVKDLQKAKNNILARKAEFKTSFFAYCQNFNVLKERQTRELTLATMLEDMSKIINRYRKADFSDTKILEAFQSALNHK